MSGTRFWCGLGRFDRFCGLFFGALSAEFLAQIFLVLEEIGVKVSTFLYFSALGDSLEAPEIQLALK